MLDIKLDNEVVQCKPLRWCVTMMCNASRSLSISSKENVMRDLKGMG